VECACPRLALAQANLHHVLGLLRLHGHGSSTAGTATGRSRKPLIEEAKTSLGHAVVGYAGVGSVQGQAVAYSALAHVNHVKSFRLVSLFVSLSVCPEVDAPVD
jgi:hypothetical protein